MGMKSLKREGIGTKNLFSHISTSDDVTCARAKRIAHVRRFSCTVFREGTASYLCKFVQFLLSIFYFILLQHLLHFISRVRTA